MDNLKEFRGLSYTKIKFDGCLSDYQHNIILKIIEYVKGFVVTKSNLECFWTEYNLPMPVKPTSYIELLETINNHSYFCIQDNNGKRHINYFNHKHYTPSLILNQAIKGIDKAIGIYRNERKVDREKIVALAQTLNVSLILINNYIAGFFFDNKFDISEDVSIEEYQSYHPDRNFFNDARLLYDDIESATEWHRLRQADVPKRVVVRIDLPHVRNLKFHFNVNSPDDKKYQKFNHTEIEASKHDDSLIPVLDILKTSNLYYVK